MIQFRATSQLPMVRILTTAPRQDAKLDRRVRSGAHVSFGCTQHAFARIRHWPGFPAGLKARSVAFCDMPHRAPGGAARCPSVSVEVSRAVIRSTCALTSDAASARPAASRGAAAAKRLRGRDRAGGLRTMRGRQIGKSSSSVMPGAAAVGRRRAPRASTRAPRSPGDEARHGSRQARDCTHLCQAPSIDLVGGDGARVRERIERLTRGAERHVDGVALRRL